MKPKIMLLVAGILIIAVSGVMLKELNAKNDINSIQGLEVIKNDGEYNQDAIEESNYIIMLSNQSFRKPKMKISVFIDGIEIIDQKCNVEDQHKGYYYYFNLEGEHEITVKSGDGLTQTKRINFVSGELTWSSIMYWNYEGEEPQIIHEVQDNPFLWM